jgi:hypothetical protein
LTGPWGARVAMCCHVTASDGHDPIEAIMDGLEHALEGELIIRHQKVMIVPPAWCNTNSH